MKCRCGHADEGHCKGGVGHSTYKDQARMVPNPELHYCATRHCLAPLCDCVDLVEAA